MSRLTRHLSSRAHRARPSTSSPTGSTQSDRPRVWRWRHLSACSSSGGDPASAAAAAAEMVRKPLTTMMTALSIIPRHGRCRRCFGPREMPGPHPADMRVPNETWGPGVSCPRGCCWRRWPRPATRPTPRKRAVRPRRPGSGHGPQRRP